MMLRLGFLLTLFAYSTHAVVVNTYGPPRPAAHYGPPPSGPQHVPHREYGVPQKIPFHDYGPPALKYGPPKLNFIAGGGSSGGGLHEQIKAHFGVPKPFYGPPHLQSKPAQSYGPPPQPLPRPQQQYGPPPRPVSSYGPPPQQQNRPAHNYGPPPPPRPSYGPPPPQSLPATHPAPLFKPGNHPATSYGPPPSGPLHLPSKPFYGPPKPSYGPPSQSVHLPGPQAANFNRVPEATIIVTKTHIGGGGNGGVSGFGGGPGFSHSAGTVKEVQIQIDASGHTHSVSGSQAPFHTACDGWKPIPAPVGAYVENNHIDTQSGYSHVAQGTGGFGTQYNAGSNLGLGTTGAGAAGNIIAELTDEQLVAVALQADSLDNSNNVQIQTQTGPAAPLPPTGPAEIHVQNSIQPESPQISLGSTDDSYSQPPSDSFAPGSVHEHKYNTIAGGQGNFGLIPPNGNYGPPFNPSASNFAQGHSHFSHHSAASSSAGLGLHYGTQSGNVHPFPPLGNAPPSNPVSFRPPVPQGLLESIGATVQHLDQFGVKPPIQPPTYIPPAAEEVAQSGAGNLAPEYGAPPSPLPPPPHVPANIIEQNLPIQDAPQFNYLPPVQQPRGNSFNHFGPPLQAPPPELVPLPQQQSFAPPPPNQQYLSPPPTSAIYQQQGSGSAASEHSQGASQYNQHFVHTQGLPQAQGAHFNQVQVHNCGHGPNLVGTGYQFQQQQYAASNVASATTGSAYNAIAQSIPVAEQHTEFIMGPDDSYGAPASGNDIDHLGYASQKAPITALPDGTDPLELPGLDGLNVISAQKSQSIPLTSQHLNAPQTSYQLEFGGAAPSPMSNEQSANHEEILSEGLLQSILSAIEQSKPNHQHQNHHQQQVDPRTSHNAQSRSDTDVYLDTQGEAADNSISIDSTNSETKTLEPGSEEEASVREIKAIVPLEVEEVETDSNEDVGADGNHDVSEEDAKH